MIKAVLIDIDNTLLDFDKGSEEAIKVACERCGVAYNSTLLSAFFEINPMLWKAVEDGEITTAQLFDVRWNTIFKSIGAKADGHAFEKVYHGYLQSSAVPVKGAMSALEYLHSKLPVYAASNASLAQQEGRLKRAGMLDCFEGLFVSEDIGSPKPTKEFFDACFSRLKGISPCEVLMIGDSLSADIVGAKNYGLKTCWFNRASAPVPTDLKIDFIISDLKEIRNIV